MKLSGRRSRPIQRTFRPEGPLVYARLSDPILVTRAKAGDRRAAPDAGPDAPGLSFEEIFAVSGMPVGTAKCYAHRGRAKLRGELEDVA